MKYESEVLELRFMAEHSLWVDIELLRPNGYIS